MSHKKLSLKAELKDDEFNPYIESITWFNATGGSDKHLELRIYLVDEFKNVVTNQLLKIKAELIFDDSGEKIPNVPVLKKNNVLLFEIKKDSTFMVGKIPAVIRFRINDVSSSYQHRRFRILISPEADNFSSIVNSVSTIPILVKSKKGNSKRERESDDGNTNVINNNNNDMKKSASAYSMKSELFLFIHFIYRNFS